jgi:hypothetical protein
MRKSTVKQGPARLKLPQHFRCIQNHAGLCDTRPLSFDEYVMLVTEELTQLSTEERTQLPITAGVDHLCLLIKRMEVAQKLTSLGVLLQLCCLYDALCVCTEQEFDDLWNLFSQKSMFDQKQRHQVALFHARMSMQYLNKIELIVHDSVEFVNHVQGTLWWEHTHIYCFCAFRVDSIYSISQLKLAICSSSRQNVTTTNKYYLKLEYFLRALRSTGVPLATTKNALHCTADIKQVANYY